LPQPPGPTTVTSRSRASNAVSARSSAVRPTNEDAGAGAGTRSG
jgi:hypothetical protein